MNISQCHHYEVNFRLALKQIPPSKTGVNEERSKKCLKIYFYANNVSMLKIVSNTALELCLEFSVNKFYCIAFGSELKQRLNLELS